jgi:LCP family protein required for cell wall assembly
MAADTETAEVGSRDRRGGARRRRRAFRRAKGLPGAMGITFLGAVIPGAGYVWSGRRLGYVTMLPCLALAGLAVMYARDFDAMVALAFDPARLRTAAVVLAGALLLWVFVVVTTYLMVRPRSMTGWRNIVGVCSVGVLCLAVAATVTLAARYAVVQADLVKDVFEDNETVTAPADVTVEDPWGGRKRVSVLLLGGDGAEGRVGVRTDTVILLSMDVQTGDSVMFSLPRNMMNAPFPEGSPLAALYPDGFRGDGDPGFWMLNAIYGQVPILHPQVLGRSDNEGADAIKQAVAGSLGIPVDYYILVNLQGFRQVVDAMGGVTVNINEPVPIGGNTDRGIPPVGYLQPGPDQRLNGFQALWFARGRWGSSDYARMLRQRCMVKALMDEAKPLNLIRRYESLVGAGKEIVRTDISAELLPAFVDLALKVTTAHVRSVAFVSSARFYPGDPDFDLVQSTVRQALRTNPSRSPVGPPQGGTTAPATPSPSPTIADGDDGPAVVEVSDSCTYNPAS